VISFSLNFLRGLLSVFRLYTDRKNAHAHTKEVEEEEEEEEEEEL
jgi:hypothetical protein